MLYSEAAVMILDEPFAMVDPIHKDMIAEHIRNMRSSKAILMSDHAYQFVVDTCDRLLLLSNGTIVEVTPEDLEHFGYVPKR